MENTQEYSAWKMSGFIALFLGLFLVVGSLVIFKALFFLSIPVLVVLFIGLGGFVVIRPNHSCVLVFFGKYHGSIRESGFFWVNPLTGKEHVSLRVNNFNSETIKVNDSAGNPIEIASVIVWRVVDTYRALFEVEHYPSFVAIQSETAIRSLASRYPYDTEEEDVLSLRGHSDELTKVLQKEVQARLEVAGVEIIEARISHLAYAPEIAQAMLRRQQAQAVIAARQKIVEGAVGMVEMALEDLSDKGIVDLDNERKAIMVNNLMVALISEQGLQPVISTGT